MWMRSIFPWVNNVAATCRRIALALLMILLLGVVMPARVAMAQLPEQQEEFTPISELPPEEKVPAAPLLIGAYSFVVAALFVYLFSVSRRLTTVQREVERLEGDMKRAGRA